MSYNSIRYSCIVQHIWSGDSERALDFKIYFKTFFAMNCNHKINETIYLMAYTRT